MASYHFDDPTLVHLDNVVQDSRDNRLSGAQTGATIWTPATGKTLRITSITVITDAEGIITVFRGTDAEGNRLVDGSFTTNGGIDKSFTPPYGGMDVDEPLKITCSSACRCVVFGYEV